MSMLRLSQLRCASTSSVRLAGAGPSPGWGIPVDKQYHKHTYQPTIPDKHFNTSHYNYAPITLWLRARRPTMEKCLADVQITVRSWYGSTVGALIGAWGEHLPGFGVKVLGFVGVLLGYNLFTNWVLSYCEAYMNLEKLRLHGIGFGLFGDGFFLSESEDQEQRIQEYNVKSIELEELWTEKMAEATQTRDFSKLVSALSPESIEKDHNRQPLKPSVSWRFNQMPYGRNSPDVVTFPDNGIDSPSSSLFIWGDVGSTGDYIERVDNKLALLKKARHFYTAAYIPPTK